MSRRIRVGPCQEGAPLRSSSRAVVAALASVLLLQTGLALLGIGPGVRPAQASPATVRVHPLQEPVVDQEAVYVVGDDEAAGLDGDTGERLWFRYRYDALVDGFASGPWMVDGRLVALTQTGELLSISRGNGSLESTGLDVDRRPRSAAAHGDTILVLGQGRQVTALDVAAGETRWERNVSRLVPADTQDGPRSWGREARGETPFLDLAPEVELALVGVDRTVVALDLETGQVHWNRTFPSPPSGIALAEAGGDRVLVTAANRTGQALSPSNGSVRWTTSMPRLVVAGPVAGDGRTYLGIRGGDIRGLHTANGSLVWAHPVPGPLRGLVGPFDLAQGCVVSGCPGQGLLVAHTGVGFQAIEVGSGVVWMHDVAFDDLPVGPWVEGEAVYIPSWSGVLRKVDLASGDTRWTADLSEVIGGPAGGGVDLGLVAAGGIVVAAAVLGGATLVLFPPWRNG